MQVVIKDGEVDGKPILRAWESWTGWYWFATEPKAGDVYFGLVLGVANEWGYFSALELAACEPKVWELKRSAIDLIDKVVTT